MLLASLCLTSSVATPCPCLVLSFQGRLCASIFLSSFFTWFPASPSSAVQSYLSAALEAEYEELVAQANDKEATLLARVGNLELASKRRLELVQVRVQGDTP